jgi:hypothetical protein
MDFWTAYISLGVPFAVALGAIVKNSPKLYLAIRPFLRATQAALIGAQVGALVGAMLTANHVNETIETAKLSTSLFVTPPVSVYLYPTALSLTLIACLTLADLCFNFLHANSDQENKDREKTDRKPD